MDISVSLVQELITQQFPQWADLTITPVSLQGWDNRTFHLGADMLVRMPSAAQYAQKVSIEQTWLPLLAPFLSYTISTPLAMGIPSEHYPYHWSIYRFVEGISANLVTLNDAQLEQLAIDTALFLKELRAIDTTGAPTPGLHNFYRGAHPGIYTQEVLDALALLHNIIDTNKAQLVWDKALASEWKDNPVWLHGDMSNGNIIIKNNRLEAVIDFGGMAVGDPACDLVIAWTLFRNTSRKLFKTHVALDKNTWNRARGWALWKALITLAKIENKTSTEAVKQHTLITELLTEV